MESKLQKNLIPASLIIVILAIGFFAGRFILGNISSTQNKNSQPAKNAAEIDKKTYDSIASPNTGNASISLDQSGFGRENPFAPYK